MFVDDVVLAGVVTVGLMVAFLGGFGYFIWKIQRARKAFRRPMVAFFLRAIYRYV